MSPSLDAPGVAEVGKTALVTGGGSGIGLATARALAAAGFDVVAAGLEAAAASDTGIRYVQADIADLAGHAALLDAAGPLACLVNCAGVTSLVRGDMLELTPESFDRTMGVNLRGTFFLTQAVARRMLEAPPARSPRSIVSIGSINAEIVGENRADYCMSKTALGMMTRLFAARLATAGVAVFEVRPGIIRTAMTAPAAGRYDAFIAEGGVPARRWGEPEDVAAAVATLAQGGIPYATGIVIEVAGGMQLHRV